MKLHVRITLAAILLLIAVPGSASPGNFRFGAEWGVLYNFISLEKSTLITADRYLVESSNVVRENHINGMLTVSAGYDIRNRVCISLCSGYLGAKKGERMVPLTLRTTVRLTRNPEDAGSLVFIESGAGFRKSSQISLLYRAGYGYRIPITGSVAVNVNASALFSLSHPDVYDKYSNQMVSKKNLGMSRAFNSGILLSLAIVF